MWNERWSDITHRPLSLSSTQTPCLLSPDLRFHISHPELYPKKSACPCIFWSASFLFLKRNPDTEKSEKRRHCLLDIPWHKSSSNCITNHWNPMEFKGNSMDCPFCAKFQLFQFFQASNPIRSHAIQTFQSNAIQSKAHLIQFHPTSFRKMQTIFLWHIIK